MILAKSIVEARAGQEHRQHGDGRESMISRFFKASASDPQKPMAFLVEKKPYGIVPPHFHEVNQFQVIADGSGRLGKQEVQPFTVHYTNGYTGYGPICAAEDGIAFYTLRNHFDPGAKYFPESRPLMKPAPKRHRVSEHLPLSDAAALQNRQSEELETVFPEEADGLAGWFLRAVPGSTTQAPDPKRGGGQYVIVANGTMHYNGQAFPKFSCAYVSADAGPMTMQAGADGLELLILQFPTAEAYPPPPPVEA